MLPGEGVKLSFKAFFISLCLNLAVIFFTMKTPGINLGKPKKNRLFLVARPLRPYLAPSSLVATFFSSFFLEVKLHMRGPAFTPPPPSY